MHEIQCKIHATYYNLGATRVYNLDITICDVHESVKGLKM
jgi:hypothetical protein